MIKIESLPVSKRKKTEPIFAFEDPIDYLNFELKSRRGQDPKFSMRSWARDIGYENPSFLAQVLKRERKLKSELAMKIAQSLRLSGKALKYFEVMVIGSSAQDPNGRSAYKQVIRNLRPKNKSSVLSLEVFAYVSEWFHYALTEMPQLKDFSSSEDFIVQRLGKKVDRRIVREALDRLVRLGFLVRTAAGEFQRAPIGNYTMDPDTANQALRSLHRSWLELATQALDEQDVKDRDFYGTTFSFKKQNIAKVKEIIRNCHQQILELEATTAGDEIYQFSTQLFQLTKPLKQGRQ